MRGRWRVSGAVRVMFCSVPDFVTGTLAVMSSAELPGACIFVASGCGNPARSAATTLFSLLLTKSSAIS